MKKPELVMMLLVTAILSGCAQLKLKSENSPGNHFEQLVAVDLVNALMQLEGYHPTSINLQMSMPKSGFGHQLKRVLGEAGYAIQDVSTPKGNRHVAYSSSTQKGTIAPGVTTYQINIAEAMLKRSYYVSDGEIRPDSDLYVIGVDSSKVRLNDHIFTDDRSLEVSTQSTQSTQSKPVELRRDSMPETYPVAVPDSPKPTKTETFHSMQIQLVNEQGTGTYRVGDPIYVSVMATTDSQMNCYYRDGDGDVVKMFPNRYTPDNYLLAGETLVLPGSSMWHIEATKVGSTDEIMCLAVPTVGSANLNSVVEEDFEPLPVAGLDQIYDRYRLEIGEHVLKENLVVTVN